MHGYVQLFNQDGLAAARDYVAGYVYDDTYPFTNTFNALSRADYISPVMVFGGSYKQIEECWPEYLAKFARLLSGLNALSARVSLDCTLGSYSWSLLPQVDHTATGTYHSIGKPWMLSTWPADDFSSDPAYFKGLGLPREQVAKMLDTYQLPRCVP